MAHQVCEDDPRTLGQRRADALGTLGAGSTVLAASAAGRAARRRESTRGPVRS
jgi:hypothetical protein